MSELDNVSLKKLTLLEKIISIVAWSSFGCGFFLLFCVFGNSHEPERFGSSIVGWLFSQWQSIGSESGHGFLIPFVSMYFLWRRRAELIVNIQKGHVDCRAFAVIAIALLLYWAGVRAQQPRLGVISLITLLWSVPWLLYGLPFARKLVVPCAYLGFAIPMGFLSSATLPLRLIATRMAVFVLQGFGFGVARKGTAILSAEPGRFALDVADACSGLRSIVALCALIAAFAYIAHSKNWRRWTLFMCAIPIAIAGNVVRIITLVLVASVFGSDKVLEIAHDYSGYIVFTVAVLLMIAISRQLGRIDGYAKTS